MLPPGLLTRGSLATTAGSLRPARDKMVYCLAAEPILGSGSKQDEFELSESEAATAAARPARAGPRQRVLADAQDLSHFVRRPADGVAAMDLVVDGVYCGACIVAIEKGLSKEAGVRGARVNLASKRVTVEWDEGSLDPPAILERLEALGYPAYPFAPEAIESVEIQTEKRLLRCLGVAAFGAMNVMLLSISLWAGADNDQTAPTRDLFHWLSALVALPTAAYAGQPFFESAARALRARSVNMDVPISLAVILALGMSMLQTFTHERVAYFDSALMLLMFLLVGRYLDQRMRRRTRDFAINLSAIRADRALKLFDGGEARETPIAAIEPGDLVLVRAGERIAVDGVVEHGRSEVDQSLVTGETPPSPSPPALRFMRGPSTSAAPCGCASRARRAEPSSMRSTACWRARSSSARPTCASPTAPRSFMCLWSTPRRLRPSSAGLLSAPAGSRRFSSRSRS